MLNMGDHSKWERTDRKLVLFLRVQMEACKYVICPKIGCGRQLVELQFLAICSRGMANIRDLVIRGLRYKTDILSIKVPS